VVRNFDPPAIVGAEVGIVRHGVRAAGGDMGAQFSKSREISENRFHK
jgi:hypothetical protein